MNLRKILFMWLMGEEESNMTIRRIHYTRAQSDGIEIGVSSYQALPAAETAIVSLRYVPGRAQGSTHSDLLSAFSKLPCCCIILRFYSRRHFCEQ